MTNTPEDSPWVRPETQLPRRSETPNSRYSQGAQAFGAFPPAGRSTSAGEPAPSTPAPASSSGNSYPHQPPYPPGTDYASAGQYSGGLGYSAGPGYGAGTTSALPSTSRRQKPSWGMLTLTAVLSAALASAMSLGVVHYWPPAQPDTTVATSDSAPAPAAPVSSSSHSDWQSVAAQVKDSVVSITTRTERGADAGSGVILDTTGHILTNDHVISGAQEIVVTLSDGRMYPARLQGTDPATDLAVITIEKPPSGLQAATFADSSQLVVGQAVVAVGNPLGLSNTVTTGVISALNRPVTTQKPPQQDGPLDPTAAKVITNAVQIDASINPGNSGGPVFDAAGKVIGISSSIATLGEDGNSGSIGLGFAIPANLASMVSSQLITSGKAEHAFLGVSVTNGQANSEDAVRAGAVVRQVEAGGPAAAAGLNAGDVITAIDGQAVISANSLIGFVRQHGSGDKVTLTYVRDGKQLDTQVTLAVRSDNEG